MERREAFGITGTVLVHALVLLLVLPAKPVEPIPPPPPEPEIKAFIVNDNIQALEDRNITDPNKKDCTLTEKTYIGVGILYDSSGLVLSAPPHLPAYLAGVREGDIIGWDLILKVTTEGKPITFHVIRHGIVLTFTVTPVRICYH